VVVPQDEIHDVGLAVEQAEQAHPKQDARVAVPGCTTRSAVARTRSHVAGRAPGGSILRRRPGARGRVLPLRHVAGAPGRSILRRRPGARGGVLPLRGAQAAAALGGLPPKPFGTGEICTAHSAHAALHCPSGAGS
jgi:hypothetical protein